MNNGDVDDPGIVDSDADAGNIRCVIIYYYERTKASSYHCFARPSEGVSTCARTHPVYGYGHIQYGIYTATLCTVTHTVCLHFRNSNGMVRDARRP
jgi:hypothetical protein